MVMGLNVTIHEEGEFNLCSHNSYSDRAQLERWTHPNQNPASDQGKFDPRFHGFKGPLGISNSGLSQITDPLVLQTSKDLRDEFPFIGDANTGRPIGVCTLSLVIRFDLVNQRTMFCQRGCSPPLPTVHAQVLRPLTLTLYWIARILMSFYIPM